MQPRKAFPLLPFVVAGGLLLSIVIGQRHFQRLLVTPVSIRMATPPPPPPPLVDKMTAALEKAPYVERLEIFGENQTRSYWHSGKLVLRCEDTSDKISVYSQGKVWQTTKRSKYGFIKPLPFPPTSDSFINWQNVNFRKSRVEGSNVFYFPATRMYSLEHELKLLFDSATYLPISINGINRMSSSPHVAITTRPVLLDDRTPPRKAPSSVPPSNANNGSRILFRYPKTPPDLTPTAHVPSRTWIDIRAEQTRWRAVMAKPLMQFQMLKKPMALMRVERNEWGDILLYVAGDYPFRERYFKKGQQNIRVRCQIIADIDGKSKQVADSEPLFTDLLPEDIEGKPLRLYIIPSDSLDKASINEKLTLSFIAQDKEGTVLEKHQWAKTDFRAGYPFSPPHFPPDEASSRFFSETISSNRIAFWFSRTSKSSLPSPAQLDRLNQLLEMDIATTNTISQPDRFLRLQDARWQLIQMNLKAQRKDEALKVARRGEQLQHAFDQSSFKTDKNRWTIDWQAMIAKITALT